MSKTITKCFVTEALLSQYFALLRQERIGSTPEITAKADKLQSEIKERLDKEKLEVA